jgi:hypothetical protein
MYCRGRKGDGFIGNAVGLRYFSIVGAASSRDWALLVAPFIEAGSRSHSIPKDKVGSASVPTGMRRARRPALRWMRFEI